MGEHRFYLSSTDSKLTGNSAINFTVQLAKPLVLTDHWEIGLNEIDITSTLDTSSDIYICSDICSDSFVGNFLFPVLRRINFKKNYRKIYADPYYSKVTRQHIQNITIFVICDDNEILKKIQHISLVVTLKWRMSV